MKTNTCYVMGALVKGDELNFCKRFVHKGKKYFILSEGNTWIFDKNPDYDYLEGVRSIRKFNTKEDVISYGLSLVAGSCRYLVFKVQMQGNSIRKYLEVIPVSPLTTHS